MRGVLAARAGLLVANALAETTIGLFKTEVIHRRGPWRSLTQVEIALAEWVDWYNQRRLHEPEPSATCRSRPGRLSARRCARAAGVRG